MIRNSLAAGAVALAAVIAPTAAAFAFDAPTTSDFFGRFNVPDEVVIDLQDDGSVLLTTPAGYNGWVVFTLRDDEVPASGSRALSADLTIVSDGGGWPDRLVGFGMVHGYQDSGTPFSVGLVSPQDGGTLRIGTYTAGNGFNIGQSLGGGMEVGETVTLTMAESGGNLAFAAENGGSTSRTSMGNDLVAAAMADGSSVGFILSGGGTYRIDNLVVADAD